MSISRSLWVQYIVLQVAECGLVHITVSDAGGGSDQNTPSAEGRGGGNHWPVTTAQLTMVCIAWSFPCNCRHWQHRKNFISFANYLISLHLPEW